MMIGMKGFFLGLYQVNCVLQNTRGFLFSGSSRTINAITYELSDSANYTFFYASKNEHLSFDIEKAVLSNFSLVGVHLF